MKLGLTANSNDGDTAGNLGAADLTLRKSANSWLKVQAGRTTGLLSPSLQSNDGGFNFQGPDDQSFASSKAGAYRADLSIGLSDFIKGHDGRFQFYTQKLDAGYSAPGQMTIKDTEQYGGIVQNAGDQPPEPDGQGRSEDRGPGARRRGRWNWT